jgi:hypothetical protein
MATVRAVLLSCPPVMMPCGSRAVVQEDIDPGLGRQQRADVTFERKIRLASTLDGLLHLRIRSVDQVADLLADGLLPLGQGFDVSVDPWVSVVPRHWSFRPRAISRL